MEHKVGGQIRCLSNKIRREIGKLESIQMLDELSGTNGFIIKYISKQTEPVFQKDIEREFGITRSTASKVISLMEKKGLIERKKVNTDARLNQLVLTEKALILNNKVQNDIEIFEQRLLKGLSEEEIIIFVNLLNRISDNLKKEDE